MLDYEYDLGSSLDAVHLRAILTSVPEDDFRSVYYGSVFASQGGMTEFRHFHRNVTHVGISTLAANVPDGTDVMWPLACL